MISRLACSKRPAAFAVLVAALSIVITALVPAMATAASGNHWYETDDVHKPNRLVGATSVPVRGANTGVFNVCTTAGGSYFNVQCTHAATGGSIANPSGGVAGVLTGGSLLLTGCSVTTQEEACTVSSGGEKGVIRFVALSASLNSNGSIRFVPATREEFFAWEIGGEKCPAALKGKKVFKGTITAASSTTPGVWEFTEGSGSSFTFGGFPAYIDGNFNFETASGKYTVTVGP